MFHLIIDEGNTFVKMSIMSGKGNIDKSCHVNSISVGDIDYFIGSYAIKSAIFCSVREKNSELVDYLERRFKLFIYFNVETPIPLKNGYSTPKTIGVDRLAAAIGATEIYPNSNVLIVDLGSAITIDFVEKGGLYRGGNISPGAALRFKSLNTFTQKLPLCSISGEEIAVTAKSTKEAIESGVVLGIIYEITGYIEEYRAMYDDLKIIFTGGDAKYFGDKFKIAIFANCDIVTNGLYKVLKYNDVETQKK